MLTGIAITAVLLLIASVASAFRREGNRIVNKSCLRVFVFDATPQPAAFPRGHYDWFPVADCSKTLLCADCAEKVPDARIYKAQSAAYVCVSCGKLVWRDQGQEIPFEHVREKLNEQECAVIAHITDELSQPCDVPMLS